MDDSCSSYLRLIHIGNVIMDSSTSPSRYHENREENDNRIRHLFFGYEGPGLDPELHEYELHLSDSLTFLFNLLCDEGNTALSKSDIMTMLSSYEYREKNLPFAFRLLEEGVSVQGLQLSPELRQKFYRDRRCVGQYSWFRNVPGSREAALATLDTAVRYSRDEFFKFESFYSKLNNHITHFQLRSLVVCGDTLKNGIFYPSRCIHDNNLHQIHEFDHNGRLHNFFKLCQLSTDILETTRKSMRLACIQDSRSLKICSNSRISSADCSSKFLVNGTFEGEVVVHSIEDPDDVKLLGEHVLTRDSEGIINCVDLNIDDTQIFIASNDITTRIFDLEKATVSYKSKTPFAINSLSASPHSANVAILIGDSVDAYIVDYRAQVDSIKTSSILRGHKDFGFSCDWSPNNDKLVITGNQDGTLRLWDIRMSSESIYCWNGALGSQISMDDENLLGGPVRNCKFSYYGEYVIWAESLDHVGIVRLEDLLSNTPEKNLNLQSIDFTGKCIGLNVCASEGRNEKLIIGVNDHPLGGILIYDLETPKTPQFNFQF